MSVSEEGPQQGQNTSLESYGVPPFRLTDGGRGRGAYSDSKSSVQMGRGPAGPDKGKVGKNGGVLLEGAVPRSKDGSCFCDSYYAKATGNQDWWISRVGLEASRILSRKR